MVRTLLPARWLWLLLLLVVISVGCGRASTPPQPAAGTQEAGLVTLAIGGAVLRLIGMPFSRLSKEN